MGDTNLQILCQGLATNSALRDEVWAAVPPMVKITNPRLIVAFEDDPSQFSSSGEVQKMLRDVFAPAELTEFSRRARDMLSANEPRAPLQGIGASPDIARLFQEGAAPPVQREEVFSVNLRGAQEGSGRELFMDAVVSQGELSLMADQELGYRGNGVFSFASAPDTVVVHNPNRVDEDPGGFNVDGTLYSRARVEPREAFHIEGNGGTGGGVPEFMLTKALLLRAIFPETDWDRVTIQRNIRIAGHGDFDEQGVYSGYSIKGPPEKGWTSLSGILNLERMRRFARVFHNQDIPAGLEILPDMAAGLIRSLRKLHYEIRARGGAYDPTYIVTDGYNIIPGPGGITAIVDPAMLVDEEMMIRESHVPRSLDPYNPEAFFVPDFSSRSVGQKSLRELLTLMLINEPSLEPRQRGELEGLPTARAFYALFEMWGIDETVRCARNAHKHYDERHRTSLAAFFDHAFAYIDLKLQTKAGIVVQDVGDPVVLNEIMRALDADLSRTVVPHVVAMNEVAVGAYNAGREILRGFVEDPGSRASMKDLFELFLRSQDAHQRSFFVEPHGTRQLAEFGTVALAYMAYGSQGDFYSFVHSTESFIQHRFDRHQHSLTWTAFVDAVDPSKGLYRAIDSANPLVGFTPAFHNVAPHAANKAARRAARAQVKFPRMIMRRP